MQGFGGSIGQCSHFWVEADGRLLDLGPHFLPYGSSYEAAPMPAIAWDINERLPAYLRYRPQLRFDNNIGISQDAVINQRVEDFIKACRARMKLQVGAVRFPTWLLTGHAAALAAAARRNLWALGAYKYTQIASVDDLPF